MHKIFFIFQLLFILPFKVLLQFFIFIFNDLQHHHQHISCAIQQILHMQFSNPYQYQFPRKFFKLKQLQFFRHKIHVQMHPTQKIKKCNKFCYFYLFFILSTISNSNNHSQIIAEFSNIERIILIFIKNIESSFKFFFFRSISKHNKSNKNLLKINNSVIIKIQIKEHLEQVELLFNIQIFSFQQTNEFMRFNSNSVLYTSINILVQHFLSSFNKISKINIINIKFISNRKKIFITNLINHFIEKIIQFFTQRFSFFIQLFKSFQSMIFFFKQFISYVRSVLLILLSQFLNSLIMLDFINQIISNFRIYDNLTFGFSSFYNFLSFITCQNYFLLFEVSSLNNLIISNSSLLILLLYSQNLSILSTSC
ncbi:hypothetical protein IMG5_117940 [Ichthyophthirius multifiliis]|uniref:Transmembrane protein n=1 Tax=Ichthyophthirius multifiliis TaxID=5932 RepID=G0QUM3_ICHMU|nr:hypothetical protein IMG5_117940 [Ichthyophthirius multifiliis]EGR31069.1 hypothetical protein IMG5_117940 [Ichthyophthirius multifiliis]|eukprot:XP_004034555.1 hypothetical protein IMG5_117940 [Ichthyophthirius multifiliis]